MTLSFSRGFGITVFALWAGSACFAHAASSSTPGAAADAVSGFDTTAVQATLQRLLPGHAEQFELVATASPGSEHYRVDAHRGHVRIAASSASAMLVGVNSYLHRIALVDLGWPGESTSRLPARLPLPGSPFDGDAVVPDRFALNDTDDAYSDAYLDWEGWQHKIDLLALHGINEVFMPVGTEEVYRRTFTDFGYTDAQIRAWIPDPAHQPWWLLQNLARVGSPVSPQVYDRRVAMARRIVARLRELGMTPVFPGYFGTVPAGFVARHPRAHVIAQGLWCGLERPDWLDPRDPLYARIAADFYRHQRELFGDSTLYKMDLLHEGGKAGDVPLKQAVQQVWSALHQARPTARWVLLGWMKNPSVDEIEGAGKNNLLIIDGLSDRLQGLDRETQWLHAPYAFGTIPNFGGHLGLGADTGVWFQRYPAWRSKAASAVHGIAYLPEGSGTDSATFTLFTQWAWSPLPSDRLAWFRHYADLRYGGVDAHAEAAWQAMAKTAYDMPADGRSESQDSLFDAVPDLKATKATNYGPDTMRYDAQAFAPALTELLQVAPALRRTSAYRHDLVDVARQVMENRSRTLLPEIREAYERKDRARFKALADTWLADMSLLDRLLASDPHFLLGRWLEHARSAGVDAAESKRLTVQQLTLILHWSDGSQPAGVLQSYANRDYAGLVGTFYRSRWARYFRALENQLAEGTPIPAFDWVAMSHDWAANPPGVTTTPVGDPYRLAREVATRLHLSPGR